MSLFLKDVLLTYNKDNVFSKILSGILPKESLCENKYALAFHDLNPKAPIHIIVIPKGFYISAHEFYSKASSDEIVGFGLIISRSVFLLGIEDSGYRLISNQGPDGGQEIYHFHIHILAGKSFGPILC